MKRAMAFACLVALTSPACAEAVGKTAPPIATEAQREAIALRVRGGASCASCDLFQIDLSYADLGGRDFSGARIAQSDLSLAAAEHTRFRGANLTLANLFGVRMSGADLTDANLDHAMLVGAELAGARMAGAVLTGANLSGAAMNAASGLTQAQLNRACGDSSTALPPGLTVPRC